MMDVDGLGRLNLKNSNYTVGDNGSRVADMVKMCLTS
jgi:hypothetical protein